MHIDFAAEAELPVLPPLVRRGGRGVVRAVLVGLVALLGLAPAAWGEEGDPPHHLTIRAAPLASRPVLDGDLSEWAAVGADTTAALERADQALPGRPDPWEGPADASASVRVGVYGDDLYLGVAVTDDVAFHSPSEYWWHGDSLELFLNADVQPGRPPPERYTDGCWQIFFMPLNEELSWGVVFHGTRMCFDDGGLEGVELAHRKRADGYDFEVRLPLANFGIEDRRARTLGFALALNDADEAPAKPGTYLSWNAGSGLYLYPHRFGTLELPTRTAPPLPTTETAPTGPPMWALLAVLVSLAAALVLAGPGARTLARLGPRPKLVALALIGVLAVGLHLDQRWRVGDAESDVHNELATLAERAETIAADARAVGALAEPRAEARSAALAALLRGEAVPCRPGVEASAFVPLHPRGAHSDDRARRYRVSLTEAQAFLLPRPVTAGRLRATLTVAQADRAQADPPRALGRLRLQASDGSETEALLPGLAPGAASGTVAIELDQTRDWTRLLWTPDAGARGAVLHALEAFGVEGAPLPIPLSGLTEEGIPILAHPGGPDHGRNVEAGTALSVPIPPLLGGADRLWLVLHAARAFPDLPGDQALARVSIDYEVAAETPDLPFDIRNGKHVAAERLPPGMQRPGGMRSRVAYQWQDTGGYTLVHDAIPLRLDTARRPRALTIENLGPGGTLRVVAATVVRTRRPGDDSRVLLVRDESQPTDSVQLLEGADEFAPRLERMRTDAVELRTVFGSDDEAVTLRLAAPLPAWVGEKRERTEVALLTCLAIALFTLVLLVVDGTERFRFLSRRLSLGVLAAALVPLAVTIVLVERSNAARVESEHGERARAALTTLSGRLHDELRQTQDVAGRLARHLATTPGARAASEIVDLVELYAGPPLPTAVAGTAIVAGAQLPTTQVPLGAGKRGLNGTRFLPVSLEPGAFHLSPWDGLVLLGNARAGGADDWVRVTLGIQARDALLGGALRETLAAGDALAVVVGAKGRVLARAGDDADGFAATIASHANAIGAQLEHAEVALVPELAGPSGAYLAVATRLAPEGVGRDATWVALGFDRSLIDATVARQREPLIWLALFGLVLVVSVASLIARRVAKPVRDLVRVTDAVRRGTFDVHVPAAGVDEVGELTVAFDQMRLDLKNRVADLDFLRTAQEAVASSLDFQGLGETVLELFERRYAPDACLLLDVQGAGGLVSVMAQRGRENPFSDRSFAPAGDGWIRAALEQSEPLEIERAVEDERVQNESAFARRLTEGMNAWLAVPLESGAERQGLVVLLWREARASRGSTERGLLRPLAGIAAAALGNARLYRLAALDVVTRLPGSTAFEAALRTDVDRALAGGPAAVLLRVGLDHLEHVTLRRGVESSRQLLRVSANALRAAVGDRGLLGRLREMELAVRLPGASNEEAHALAERIRARLGAIEVSPEEGGPVLATTISVGIARAPKDAGSVEFLLDAAGRALAAAQREGGDRVEDVTRLDAGAVEVPPFEEGAIFRNEKMVRVVDAARRAARSDTSVLITGETGTGKEVIADLIHRRSARAERPFVTVNCAAFPETLLESELFGYERGAFTGAERRREGRFELADGGTLFLDEIAEMTPSAQVKLLRVLQERQFTRLGGTRTITVDVRIIAATNRDLERAVAEGSFREDLYYRLNVIRLELPPLRERREEIPHLVEKFLKDFQRRARRGPTGLTPAAMDVLYRHPWPGNVRELKNAMERCAVLCEADVVGPEHLQLDGARGQEASYLAPRSAPHDDLNPRQRHLLDYLARNGRCTNREYYEMTGTSPRTALRDLQSLMERGLLIREGRRRGAVYRLP